MTLREQRAIVYPPNYSQLLDEWWLYETKKDKRKIIFLLGIALIPAVIKYLFIKRKEHK